MRKNKQSKMTERVGELGQALDSGLKVQKL